MTPRRRGVPWGDYALAALIAALTIAAIAALILVPLWTKAGA